MSAWPLVLVTKLCFKALKLSGEEVSSLSNNYAQGLIRGAIYALV